jgi:hypothetical protein
VVEEGIKAGVKMSVHIVGRSKSKSKSQNPYKMVRNPQIKEFACLGVIF